MAADPWTRRARREFQEPKREFRRLLQEGGEARLRAACARVACYAAGMPTTTKPATPTIRLIWPNPRELRPTLVRETPRGARGERRLGPRAVLSLAEAAVVLQRSAEEVRRAIRTGFLRACRRRPRPAVTFRSCQEFLREEAYDGRVAKARIEADAAPLPAAEVYRDLGM